MKGLRTLGLLMVILGVYLFFYTLPIVGLGAIAVGIFLFVRGRNRNMISEPQAAS
jgi:hypothetical protein